MTLPVSGSISMLQIYAEFGAPVGTPFTQMVRGGAYVPNTGPNAGVPTAPPLGMQHFYGASGSSPFFASKSGDAAAQTDVGGTGPATMGVTSPAITIFKGGGTGSYSCTWSHLSGNASISTPGANNFAPTFNHPAVPRNTVQTAVKRCAASDGVTTINVDVNVSLAYFDNM